MLSRENPMGIAVLHAILRPVFVGGVVEVGGILGEIFQAGEGAGQHFGRWCAVIGNGSKEIEHVEQGAMTAVGGVLQGLVAEIVVQVEQGGAVRVMDCIS